MTLVDRVFKALKHHDDPKEILDAFLLRDHDRNYLIEQRDFRSTLSRLGARLADRDLEALARRFEGRRGQVDYQAFMQEVFDCDAEFPGRRRRKEGGGGGKREEAPRRAPAVLSDDSDVDTRGHSRTLKRSIRKKIAQGLDSNFSLKVELERAGRGSRRGELEEREFKRVLKRLRDPLSARELETLIEWLPSKDPRMVNYTRLWSALGIEFEDDDVDGVPRHKLSQGGESDARRRGVRQFRDFLARPTRRGEQTGLDVVEGACRMHDQRLHGRTLGRLPPRALQEALHEAGLRLDASEVAGLASAVDDDGNGRGGRDVNYLELLSRYGPRGAAAAAAGRRRRGRKQAHKHRDGWESDDSARGGGDSSDSEGEGSYAWDPLPGSLGEWLQSAASPSEIRHFHDLLKTLQNFEKSRGLGQRRAPAIGDVRPTADHLTLHLGSALKVSLRFHV